jgi:putative DNA primase/helicase
MTRREGRPGNAEATNRPAKVQDNRNAPPLSVPDIEPDADNLAAALAWAKAGWHVLPVSRGTKNPGSVAVVGKRWQHKSSRDPKVIGAWFAGTDHDIAVHCGRSGAVVLDVDHPELVPEHWRKHLDTAPYQSTRPDTPRRGHYIYAMPPDRSIGNPNFPGGEVRGLNGVIIVANSSHKDGGEYRLVRAGLVPVLPDEIADQLPDSSPGEDAATDTQVAAFLAEHTRADLPHALAGPITRLRMSIHDEQSRHASTVSALVWAMEESAAGCYRADVAQAAIKDVFLTAIARQRKPDDRVLDRARAKSEWRGMLAWAVGQANAKTAVQLAERRARAERNIEEDNMSQTTEEEVGEDLADDETITHSAHLGMAHKLASQFKDKLLYVNKHGWFRWDGKRWAPDENGAARRAVHAVIRRDRRLLARLNLPNEEYQKRARQIARYETASAITGILTEAAALEAFSVEIRDLDADPWLFNCANGTLDLRTMTLRPHDQADRITKVANAAYDPKPIARDWPQFLDKVLPDKEARDYFQRMVALALLGEVNGDKQIAPIMHGDGANGKTTAVETISFALGDYAMAAEPTLLMAKRNDVHPTGIADLLGRRFVSVVETERGRRFDLALLKWLTGGDTLKARRMRQDFFSFTPTHLLVMATNHLPVIDDGTEAVWRRIRLIPFTVQIPEDERDTQLSERLRAEADAVLAWIVGGWEDYRRRGRLDEPQAVLLATSEYRSDSDVIGRFITEECYIGSPQIAATTSLLYQRWETWANHERLTPLSRVAFGRMLDAKGYPADQKSHDRVRRGICLIDRRGGEAAGQ